MIKFGRKNISDKNMQNDRKLNDKIYEKNFEG